MSMILNKIKLNKTVYLICTACVILLVLFFWNKKSDQNFYTVSSNQDVVLEKPSSENINLFRRALDGVLVAGGQENNYPVAVMIDNHLDARPSSGISQAGVVIEAEAEGGITRYLAIFDSSLDIKKIGPIRSARPYFIDWAKEFSALYVHVGGSPEALVKVIKEKVNDLNEFYKGEYFWRGTEKFAPHNVFTSMEKIKKYFSTKDFSSVNYFSWNFKDDLSQEKRPNAMEIKIDYVLRDYKVMWKYDKENNYFVRYLNGDLHREEDGTVLFAKNLIIQKIDARETDEDLRLDMDVIGEGEAVVCLDGSCQNGKWQKKNSEARTRFYDANNEEFVFNAGPSWINVVRPEYSVELGDVNNISNESRNNN